MPAAGTGTEYSNFSIAVRQAVHVFHRTREIAHRLVVRDASGPDSSPPAELRSAELCVPIRAGSDRVGVIELWGLPRSMLDGATAHDLAVIASWCGPAIDMAVRRQEAS